MFERYFPWGIAEGASFLGRKQEISKLKNNLTHGYHTLLLSPRRYGKTSLAKHVIKLIGYPWIEIDFFVAQNEFSIEQKILKGIQSILSQIDSPERGLQSLLRFFKNSNKTWTLGIKGIKLELTPENHKDVPENILEALNALEHILHEKKKRAVIFFDEFQEIAHITNSRAIEGAIRHFAQSSKHIVFIFSGSSRHMLKHMFEDKSRPLYALCAEMYLDRLSPKDYEPYLNKIAIKTWNKKLDALVFEKIIELTECHPRYLYHLCTCLWEHCEQLKRPPNVQDINKVWSIIVIDRLKDIREILSKKPIAQIKLLALISLGHTYELTGRLTQTTLDISGSAISQNLKILEQEDYLEKLEDSSYRMIDPLLKTILIQHSSDYFSL